MRKSKRQERILKEINLRNKVYSIELSEQFNVSHDTIRRDLYELAKEGKIIKVHGGAINKSFADPFNSEHVVYALDEKRKISAKVINLLKNNMVILTEGGTTVLEFAKLIPSSLKLTVITISPQVAIT